MLLSLVALVNASPAAMSCGDGVAVCGVLTIMTGLSGGVQNVSGGAVYGHPGPIVHGLWPQVGKEEEEVAPPAAVIVAVDQ